MSETPPGGLPKSVEPQPASSTPGDGTGGLRVVAILVMIGSVLGLLGTGFCFLAVAVDGYLEEAFGILLLIAPALLFFAGSIWVCKALLVRLRK
jgi:hypothetical protein